MGNLVAWGRIAPATKDAPSRRLGIYVAHAGGRNAAPRRVTARHYDTPHDEHAVSWSPVGSRAHSSPDAAAAASSTSMWHRGCGAAARSRRSPAFRHAALSPDGQTVRSSSPRMAPRLRPASTTHAGHRSVEDHFFEQDSRPVKRWRAARCTCVARPTSMCRIRLVADGTPSSRPRPMARAMTTGTWLSSIPVDATSGDTLIHSQDHDADRGATVVARWQAVAVRRRDHEDEGHACGDIFMWIAAGGAPRKYQTGMSASAYWPAWLPTGRVYFGGGGGW